MIRRFLSNSITKGNPSKKFPVYKFAEDEACELYEPRKGEMF